MLTESTDPCYLYLRFRNTLSVLATRPGPSAVDHRACCGVLGLIDGSGLAATRNAAATLCTSALPRRGSPMERTSLTGCLILICEDQPIIAIDIANAFTDAGAQVVTASSLRDALLAVEDGGLSAAILDHALRDGDSSLLSARLRERKIPFVIHSGFSELDGVYGDHVVHVKKPAPAEVLVTTVEGLLRQRQNSD